MVDDIRLDSAPISDVPQQDETKDNARAASAQHGIDDAAPDADAETGSEASTPGPVPLADVVPETAAESGPADTPDDRPEETADQTPDSALEGASDASDPDHAAELPPPRERPSCTVGLFGKLPARGDFVTRNIPHALQRPLEDWLIPLVQETRALLGADWTAIWRGAVPWRFWIGPDVLAGSWQRELKAGQSGGAISGVLLPSADRHGRDFPLVLLLADDLARLLPPPVISPPDRGWYALCDQFLFNARAAETLEPVLEALAILPGPILPDTAQVIAPLLDRRALWAQGDGGDRIWADIASADHHLAASARSYWWQELQVGTPDSACVLSFAGLPDAQSLAFMLARNSAA